MFKAIIFDLDGTILDTIETIAYYGNLTLEKYGFAPIETKEYNFMAGNGAKHLIKSMLAASGSEDVKMFEKVFADYNEAYNRDTLYKTKVYDGIRELISAAKEKGIKLSVLSNKPHEATVDVLSKFFDEDVFDVKLGAREGVPLKPDPMAAIELAKDLGVEKEECIYVGDTDVDMKTGKSAGFYTVGVLWGFRGREELEKNGADVIVSQPSEIINLFN